MSDPRLPPIPPAAKSGLSAQLIAWIGSLFKRLNEIFRSINPPSGWKIIQPIHLYGSFAAIDTTQAQYAYVYRLPTAVQQSIIVNFVLPSDLAFFVPDEEGNQKPAELYLQVTWFSKGTSTATWRAAGEWNYITEGGQSNNNFRYLNTKDITPSGTATEVQTFEFNALIPVNNDFEPGGTIHVFFVRKGNQDTNPDDIYVSKISLAYYSDGLNTYERMPNATGSRYTKRPTFAP